MPQIALWRRIDEQPGHDLARLEERESGWLLSGTVVFLSGAGPAVLAYEVRLAQDWTTLSGHVRGFVGDGGVDAAILREERGWTLNGEPQPAVGSLLDLDFGFTPATNLQQLRRLNLQVGEKADCPVAWLEAGAERLVVLPQSYRRLDRESYDYEAPTVPYRAILRIADSGFAKTYPGGWTFETGSDGVA